MEPPIRLTKGQSNTVSLESVSREYSGCSRGDYGTPKALMHAMLAAMGPNALSHHWVADSDEPSHWVQASLAGVISSYLAHCKRFRKPVMAFLNL